MAKYITEVLKEINDDISLFNTTYKKHGDGGPLGILFGCAFMPSRKFLLPEGQPPFEPSKEPIGMTPSNMLAEIRRFYVLCRSDLRPSKRETVYIQMLEGVHPDEAKIIQAVKEQTLSQLYPNITRQVVADAGFIPPLSPEELQAENALAKKESGPRGKPQQEPVPETNA
jgi:hypothetical protein